MFGDLTQGAQGTSMALLFITGQSGSLAGMTDNAFFKVHALLGLGGHAVRRHRAVSAL